MKLNIYGHQPIIAPRDPVLPMEVTTKNYVDTGLNTHASDMALHLTPAQNAWMDAITVTAEEINSLSGAGGSLQTQIESKVAKSGDVMTGMLTLSGMPTENLHAAAKGYVDTEAAKLVSKAGSVMTGLLTLSADPTTNMHAATKQYVDTRVSDHANDDDLHLTTSQNTWLDSVTVSADEVNRLAGVTSDVQTQLDAKFDKAGGTVSGDITLGAGKAVFVSKAPATDNELVNKAYVDSKVQGQEWKDPITDANLVNVNLVTEVGADQPGAVYIVGVGASGSLEGLDGYAVYFDINDNVITLKDGPVSVGDRFGVAFGSTFTPVGAALTGKKGAIITITDATPGAIAFTEEVLTSGATTLVFDPDSAVFGNTYSLTDEGTWALTNTSVSLAAGTAIDIQGKSINVKVGQGISTDNDELTVKLTNSDALHLDDNGYLTLRLADTNLVFEGEIPALRIAQTVLDNIEDRLSKTDDSSVSGEVTFTTDASLLLGYTPVEPAHAVTKHYVDTADTAIQTQVTTIAGKVTALEADPTTKSYVDAQDATKVSKAGDTMTGFLTLHAAPSANLHAATKQYVDSSITSHINNEDQHLTAGQNVWLDAIVATSDEVNFLSGVDSPIQDQLDGMVAKTGSVMTGPLILSAAPTSEFQAANKDYVDSAAAPKVNRAGDTLTGFLTLHAAPTTDLHAATKAYVDTSVTTANSEATTQINTKVSKAGDTMTGFLTLHADPTAAGHAANKQYVDSGFTSLTSYVDNATQALGNDITALENDVAVLKADPTTKQYVDDGLATKVNKAGDTLTGYMTLHADPQQPMHATTKQYVDAVAQGLAAKPSVRFATLVNLNANYSNGTQGVNATLTGVANGALVVDGVTPNVNDRILVKAQSTKNQNGDYVVQQVGGASTPFILKRVTTLDESHEVPGSYFYVYDGATLKGTGWVFIVDNPVTFAIGTDDINVYQFSGQGNLIAGDGVYMDGNTIHVGTANSNRIVVTQDAIDLAVTGVTPGTYTKVVVDGYGRVTSATSPTTIAGYGISDAQPLNTNLTNLSNVSTVGLLVRDSGNNIATRAIETNGVGMGITNGNGGAGGNIIITCNATSVAGVDTIVSRDASGNFAANVITASLTGNASTATVLRDSRQFSVTGDVTSEAVDFNGGANVELTTTLTNTGVTAGAYTKVTVDAKGRVTLGENPDTVAGMGLIDAATIDMVNEKFADLENRLNELHLYVMSRI